MKLFDKSNALIGFYPATVGSEEKPSPSGTLKVTEMTEIRPIATIRITTSRAFVPTSLHDQARSNNPVGTVWINLSAEGYGIHGTPDAGKVSKAESHGCVRLTNWDARRVADECHQGHPGRLRGRRR